MVSIGCPLRLVVVVTGIRQDGWVGPVRCNGPRLAYGVDYNLSGLELIRVLFLSALCKLLDDC